MRALIAILAILPSLALAQAGSEVPDPQSATAEIHFAIASLGLVVALAAVHMLVRRR